MAGYTKNSNGGYSVNYDDQRFTDVKNEQTQQETQLNETYDNIINNSDEYYQNQIDAAKDYANQQSELQQVQTDFAVQQIEQQKEQAQKDYTKEQKASYADYMKQTKSNAQNMANNGLSNTGYSESSIVSMYNQYQNRVGTAKESLNQSILNYNNSIQQAILANNEKLAEIAFNALQTQNQLNQQAFEYKNTVILQKEQALQDLNNTYYARYQDVLNQINNEIDLQMELDRIDREYEQWFAEMEQQREEYKANHAIRLQELEISKRNADAAYQQAMSSIEVDKAQAEYYKAQAASLRGKNNPYSDNKTTNEKGVTELGSNAMKIYNNMAAAHNMSNANKSVFRSLIYGEVKNGHITDAEAERLFDEFAL